jgi:hypothetical protein
LELVGRWREGLEEFIVSGSVSFFSLHEAPRERMRADTFIILGSIVAPVLPTPHRPAPPLSVTVFICVGNIVSAFFAFTFKLDFEGWC